MALYHGAQLLSNDADARSGASVENVGIRDDMLVSDEVFFSDAMICLSQKSGSMFL